MFLLCVFLGCYLGFLLYPRFGGGNYLGSYNGHSLPILFKVKKCLPAPVTNCRHLQTKVEFSTSDKFLFNGLSGWSLLSQGLKADVQWLVTSSTGLLGNTMYILLRIYKI